MEYFIPKLKFLMKLLDQIKSTTQYYPPKRLYSQVKVNYF
jgi:hypothetical protein